MAHHFAAPFALSITPERYVTLFHSSSRTSTLYIFKVSHHAESTMSSQAHAEPTTLNQALPNSPMSMSPDYIISRDRLSKWESTPGWNEFVSYWTTHKEDHEVKEYPYQLDTRITGNIRSDAILFMGMSSKILVTKSYSDLYKRIKIGLLLDIEPELDAEGNLSRPVVAQKGVLITAQPGTGTLTIEL